MSDFLEVEGDDMIWRFPRCTVLQSDMKIHAAKMSATWAGSGIY